jgi:hypothetical protein
MDRLYSAAPNSGLGGSAVARYNLSVLIDQDGGVEAKQLYTPGNGAHLWAGVLAWIARVGI